MEHEQLFHHRYTKAYTHDRFSHDSPDQTRKDMCRDIIKFIEASPSSITIANIGSGPQSLENQLLSYRSYKTIIKKFEETQFYTLDISTIMRKEHNVQHIQADALYLPFKSNYMDLVVSNMAIDFIPRINRNRPYEEVYRILKPHGCAFFTFHHPRLYKNTLSDGIVTGVTDETTKKHWQWLYDTKILFHNPEDIRTCLEQEVGFTILDLQKKSDKKDTWWSVKVQKLNTNNQKS
jgi:SAM-dependent methyltransferase